MSCSKSHQKLNERSLIYKIGFYTFRSILFGVSLIFTPFIFLLLLTTLFEVLVMGKCPKNGIMTKLFKGNGNNKDEENEPSENNEEHFDMDEHSVYKLN